MPFQDYKQFIDLCDQNTSKDKAKMVELYLHNMALIDMNVWDPNAKLGDLQLMAMASWMNHEELRVVEIKILVVKEKNKPLMIRAEPSDPMALITTHNLLANDPQIALDISPIRHKPLHTLRICKGYLGMTVCMHT